MARTYGLIGTRPDLGGALARAQLGALWPASVAETTWGLGLFEEDEVLLRRGPGGPESRLLHHVEEHRSHAFLAHECDGHQHTTSSENAPPLRYGHVLFSSQGRVDHTKLLLAPVRVLLPESLTRSIQGETFTELAFALFLSELPGDSLARTRLSEPRRSADPLRAEILRRALRASLSTLDSLCKKLGLDPFAGDLWIHTGEILMVAHRQGPLALQVIRGRAEIERWHPIGESPPPGLEQSQFVALATGTESMGNTWERLPDRTLLTAIRGQAPLTESL